MKGRRERCEEEKERKQKKKEEKEETDYAERDKRKRERRKKKGALETDGLSSHTVKESQDSRPELEFLNSLWWLGTEYD